MEIEYNDSDSNYNFSYENFEILVNANRELAILVGIKELIIHRFSNELEKTIKEQRAILRKSEENLLMEIFYNINDN